MKYKTRDYIQPGEYTYHGNAFYQAEKKLRNTRCLDQCQAKDFSPICEHQTECNGLCYRFSNDREIVFKRIEQDLDHADVTLIETPFMAMARRFREENVANLIHRNKEGMEQYGN